MTMEDPTTKLKVLIHDLREMFGKEMDKRDECELERMYKLSREYLEGILSKDSPYFNYLRMGSRFAVDCYSKQSDRLKVLITVATAFFSFVDDMDKYRDNVRYDMWREDLQMFAVSVGRGGYQSYKSMEFAEIGKIFCHDLVAEVGVIDGGFCLTSLIDYALGSVIENELTGGFLFGDGWGSRWVRTKSGVSIFYVMVLIGGIKDKRKYGCVGTLEEFVMLGNDVMSFYKEHILGCESGGYVDSLGQERGITIGDAFEEAEHRLRGVCEELVKVWEGGDGKLKGRGELENRIREFVIGYLRFHLFEERYRLREVC